VLTLLFCGSCQIYSNPSLSIRISIYFRVLQILICSSAIRNTLLLVNPSHKIKIHKNIILLPVLYGCETWPLKLREDKDCGCLEAGYVREYFGLKEMK
jgi:hypothetical protein